MRSTKRENPSTSATRRESAHARTQSNILRGIVPKRWCERKQVCSARRKVNTKRRPVGHRVHGWTLIWACDARARYLVGRDARTYALLNWLLPDWLLDRVL